MQLKEQNEYEQVFAEKTGISFNKFYSKYYSKLVWQIRQYKIDANDAEELANQAFMDSLQKIDSYNNTWHYSTWLFTIGKTVALQYKKKSKLELVLDANETDSEGDDNTQSKLSYFLNMKQDNTEDVLNSQNATVQKYNITMTEISKLKPIYKPFIELSYIDGKSYEEISEIMNVDLQTVKNRIHHGKLKLKSSTKSKFKYVYNY